MKTVAESNSIRGFEKLVLLLDEAPLDLLHRAVVGGCLYPAHEFLLGPWNGVWRFMVFFFVALLVLRFGIGVARTAFPASAELKQAWRERRTLSKAYDSYQWRKLSGYGVGMLIFQIYWGHGYGTERSALYLASACIVAGIAGRIIWSRRAAMLQPAPSRQ